MSNPTSNSSSTAAASDAPARACAVCGATSALSACSTCGLVYYCSRAHQVSHWSTHKPSCRLVEVRSSHAGSGLGLWALRNVEVGARLATDKPVMLVPRVPDFAQMQSIIQLRYQALPKADQDILHSFGDAHAAADSKASVVGICLTNCLPASNGESAIYPTLCRANHSCLPNAEYSWQESSQRGVLHATRSISRGEEIFISYSSVAAFMPYAERQRHILDGFKFHCGCEYCSLLSKNENLRKQSDARRKEMAEIETKLMEETMVLTPETALSNLDKFCSLFASEFNGSLTYSQVGRIYFRMFQILIPSKRFLEKAKKMIMMAVETYTKTKGADSDVVKAYQSLADNPQDHPDFGALDEANKSGNASATASSSSLAASSTATGENKKKKKKKKKKASSASAAAASTTAAAANDQDSDSDLDGTA